MHAWTCTVLSSTNQHVFIATDAITGGPKRGNFAHGLGKKGVDYNVHVVTVSELCCLNKLT